MKRTTAKWIAIVLMAVLLLATGCSKVTKENYDKISMGMSYDEVISILGEADDCGGAVGVQNCTWGSGEKQITINFVGKKVVLFSARGL